MLSNLITMAGRFFYCSLSHDELIIKTRMTSTIFSHETMQYQIFNIELDTKKIIFRNVQNVYFALINKFSSDKPEFKGKKNLFAKFLGKLPPFFQLFNTTSKNTENYARKVSYVFRQDNSDTKKIND